MVLVLVTAGVLVRIGWSRSDRGTTDAATPPPAPVAVRPSAPTPHPASKSPRPKVVIEQRESTVCLANTASQFVLVSLARQRAWMCEGHRQVNASAITSGEVNSGYATPTGTWTVQAKQRNRWLSGVGYRDFVRYWIPFDGEYGFHDASWQTMPFGSPGYVKDGSHGCVHLPTSVAKWLYHWAVPGRTVVRVSAQ